MRKVKLEGRNPPAEEGKEVEGYDGKTWDWMGVEWLGKLA